MLMSKSRLEKFLYALYSLDSSDLPNPLSRIEELYKCLVTGEEAPTFEPISRVEKYLMAILGAYDVNELPNPISRVEVLLYKLATGDDNLDDVEIFLSEHEELLAEIIRNGGVGGNIDIEYVLHTLSTGYNTLYNTAEKPVKSAILKGNTLVNLVDFKTNTFRTTGTIVARQGNKITFTTSTTGKFNLGCKLPTLKPNTKYLLKIKAESSLSANVSFNLLNATSNNFIIPNTTISDTTYFFIADNVVDDIRLSFYRGGSVGDDTVAGEAVICEYQEGMENWGIPYFDGMQSVKMPVLTTTGKNLFHMSEIIMSDFEKDKYQSGYYGKEIQLQPNTTYTIKPYLISEITNTNVWTVFNIFNKGVRAEVVNDNYTGSGADKNSWNTQTFTTDETGVIGYSIYCHKDKEESWFSNLPIEVQLEESSVATTYEPFKSNILTVNEEVELRGIGEVKDELDLLTGELTQRIGEVVLDGSEKWVLASTKDNTYVFNLPITHSKLEKVKKNGLIMCDKLKVAKGVDEEIINLTSTIYIALLKSKVSTVEELKAYLSQNPITFIHELVEESIKTVDLSTVNQDGNNTELSTFDDLTHVTLSSEGLIPEAELEVAAKNEEVLNTMSLEMDDISTTQNDLQETSNAQSENVDATMIATTEIYEGLL